MYNVARLASVLALLALSIVISIQDEWPDINAVECAAYVRLVFVSYPNTKKRLVPDEEDVSRPAWFASFVDLRLPILICSLRR